MKKSLILLAFLSAMLCSCTHETTIAYEDDKVKVLHKLTVNVLAVHASHDEMWLVAFGKTYKDVRGLSPFYLEIPSKDSILFVTGRTFDDGQATVHVLNYKTKREIHFPAFDSSIGREIGGTTNSGGSENIESVEGDKMVISARFMELQYRYYLDLAKPEFQKQECFAPSSNNPGKTNYYLWINGKRP